ncbi:hypothetical protein SmJEL517_g00999 [Synchytrium microbalum]|uniref:Nucleolar complex-associated protein 3 n=1 Tax=Synchytrium microbalum TaxID=1806994 RepID=A0A507CBB8_9FUNG|nr:uncharacterized protein SmJEL517_g00999 [Synchytrium microbalum]TPX36912.1 hypothetical protein SmJEL517_g00999 [Synchytrium microbalum]
MRKKSKAGRQKTKPFLHEQNDEDVVISDEDERLLDEYGESTRFLARLNPTQLAKDAKPQAPMDRSSRPKATPIINAEDLEDDDDDLMDDGNDAEIEHMVAKALDSDAEDEIESNYEKVLAMRASKEEEEDGAVSRLPLRLDDGRFVQNHIRLDAPEVNLKGTVNPKRRTKLPPSPPTSSDTDDDNEMNQNAPKTIASLRDVSSLSSPEERRASLQETLASVASSIVGDPEQHMSGLKTLRELSGAQNPDSKIRKLALLTQLAVYKDIIPGYRIRQLTEAEKKTKVSKDVKKLRNFEQGLLTQYQSYLQSLDSIIVSTRKKGADVPASQLSVALVAINCMAELVSSVTHFNFRLNLLNALIARMTESAGSPLAEAIPTCCQALKTVFEQDEDGEASLEAVKLVSEAVKARKYRVDEQVIETLLSLRLREELPSAQEASQREKKRKREEAHISRKLRKVGKKDGELLRELKEAEAEVDKGERSRLHTETLKYVFVTYFRILKEAEDSPLLPAVLEGLAKFSHLINIDFFGDLLSILRQISAAQYAAYQASLTTQTHYNASSSLHCIIASFRLLSGQGEALNVDLRDFSAALYQQLPGGMMAALGSSEASDRGNILALMLSGLELMLLKKKQIPIDRVAAFAKRMLTIMTQLPSNGALACLNIMRSLLIRYPKLTLMLDPEGRLGTGEYKPFLEDPDLSNAFSTSMWELSLMKRHYHPYVRKLAQEVSVVDANSTPAAASTLALQTPTSVFRKYEWLRFGKLVFDPPLPKPSKGILNARQKRARVVESEVAVGLIEDLAMPDFARVWKPVK